MDPGNTGLPFREARHGLDRDIEYNNFFGSEKASILVIGCDPTVAEKRGRQASILSPFGLKRDESGIVHYRNPYFWRIFQNLCVILGIKPEERNRATQKMFARCVCVTNAVGEPVLGKGDSGNICRLETTNSLPLGETENSPWWKAFTKEQQGGSWRDRLCRIAAGKTVYITSERLVKPFLKEEYRAEAGAIRKEVREKNQNRQKGKKEELDYRTYHIPKEKNILDVDIYFLYRHWLYRFDGRIV